MEMIGQRVRITVLKRLQLGEELGVPMSPAEAGTDEGPVYMPPCHAFYDGQEIYYKLGGDGVPEGFCDWAWNDIFKDILAVCSRAAMVPHERVNEVEPSYTCCTDGIRPVIFKIEAV